MVETKPNVVETKPKKKKFKFTRELVRIALDEGMTQTEIAQLCRVQQSKVSAWSRGDSKALEHEVAELKKRFGHRLNRTTSRVYLVAKKEDGVQGRWEDTERAKRLLDLEARMGKVNKRLDQLRYGSPGRKSEAPDKERPDPQALEKEKQDLEAKLAALEAAREQLRTLILPGPPYKLSIEGLVCLDQEDFEAARQQEEVTQVEGPIVLRYTFVRPELVMHGKNRELTRLPVARWLIHRHPDGKFVLVAQARRTLAGGARWRWWNALRIAKLEPEERRRGYYPDESKFREWDEEVYVECTDDAGRWISVIHGPMDGAALLAHCVTYFSDTTTFHSPHDEATLPFLLKKMLVEQGHTVPGLVRIVSAD